MSHLCAMCKLTFPSREVFYAHIKKHPRCLSCKKYFKDTESLKKHYRETACTLSSIENATETVHKNNLKQPPTASKDDISFANQQAVLKQEHEFAPVPSIYKNNQLKRPSFSSSNQPPSQSPGICSFCNRTFLTQKQLDLHNQNVHGRVKCQICNQTFIDGNSLENHQFSTKPGFLFKCCICHVLCIDQSDFDSHSRGHVFNKCHVCDQSFISDMYLRQHYKMEHSDITMEENKKSNKIKELTFIVDGRDWIEIAGNLEFFL